MKRTSGRRSPSRASSSRRAAKPRRRTSCGSGTSGTRRGAVATALAYRRTGKTRASRWTSRGSNACALARQTLQVTAQGIDRAVEGLVRNRLLLVATARQDHGVLALDQSVEKALHQVALTDARPAGDIQSHCPTAPHGLERRIETLELPLAADQRRGLVRQRGSGGRDLRSLPARALSRRSTSRPEGRASGSRWSRSVQSAARSSGKSVTSSRGAGGSSHCLSMSVLRGRPRNGSRPVNTT